MIIDSYWKKRLIVTVLLVICAGAGFWGVQEDPARETWIGQTAAILNLGVFPLFGFYLYFWWKGRQERKKIQMEKSRKEHRNSHKR